MRHEPESKKQKLIQEESGVGIYSGDTVSTSSEHKTEHLPEAICEFNVLDRNLSLYCLLPTSYRFQSQLEHPFRPCKIFLSVNVVWLSVKRQLLAGENL
jgi:hypothetical protein